MAQEKTPGVYIREEQALPASIVAVATAVPAFIGYTQTTRHDETDLKGTPTRLSSLAEFERLFGGPPKTEFELHRDAAGQFTCAAVPATRFLLYYGMRLFFNNGGGPCWVVSVGGYGDAKNPVVKAAGDFADVWEPLAQEREPTMIVIPDAVLLSSADHKTVSNAALMHCSKIRSRVAILDVYDGNRARTKGQDDVISGATGFRSSIQNDSPGYGIAYYPWLNTSLVEPKELDYTHVEPTSRARLHDEVVARMSDEDKQQPSVLDTVAQLKARGADQATIKTTHQALTAISTAYCRAMSDLAASINVMPPSAAVAGLITMTDNTRGVFKAPANIAMVSVLSPTAVLSREDQEDLNAPLDGKAINAIRTFVGEGVLVWGARTLDGNSQEWRYINVRRTLIMLEQSILRATQACFFANNDAGTWQAVKAMIEDFLNKQWKAGALAGAKPADAYTVSVGLGSTMTADDILNGYLRISVGVAAVRPAEFIVLSFQLKMQAA